MSSLYLLIFKFWIEGGRARTPVSFLLISRAPLERSFALLLSRWQRFFPKGWGKICNNNIDRYKKLRRIDVRCKRAIFYDRGQHSGGQLGWLLHILHCSIKFSSRDKEGFVHSRNKRRPGSLVLGPMNDVLRWHLMGPLFFGLRTGFSSWPSLVMGPMNYVLKWQVMGSLFFGIKTGCSSCPSSLAMGYLE